MPMKVLDHPYRDEGKKAEDENISGNGEDPARLRTPLKFPSMRRAMAIRLSKALWVCREGKADVIAATPAVMLTATVSP